MPMAALSEAAKKKLYITINSQKVVSATDIQNYGER